MFENWSQDEGLPCYKTLGQRGQEAMITTTNNLHIAINVTGTNDVLDSKKNIAEALNTMELFNELTRSAARTLNQLTLDEYQSRSYSRVQNAHITIKLFLHSPLL